MEKLDSIYDFESYQDVIQHLLERHGEIGAEIVNNPNEAPVMWHECAHVGLVELPEGTVWDHEHIGTTKEIVEARIERTVGMLADPSFLEFLEQQLSDPNSSVSQMVAEEVERLGFTDNA